jgi:hypothetical protein
MVDYKKTEVFYLRHFSSINSLKLKKKECSYLIKSLEATSCVLRNSKKSAKRIYSTYTVLYSVYALRMIIRNKQIFKHTLQK